jgi:hypothetical protein
MFEAGDDPVEETGAALGRDDPGAGLVLPESERQRPARTEDDLSSAAAEVPDSLDRLVEAAGMVSIFAAQRYEWLARVRREAHSGPAPFRGAEPEMIERSLRLEIAAALRITESAAERMLIEADALVNRYPALLDTLGRGNIAERHAQVFVELVDPVEEELLDRVVPRGVELAESLPVGSFRRELRKLVDTVRAVTLEDRHRAALAHRRVAVTPADDGMAWLSALVPAVEAHAAFGRLTAIAKVIADQDEETRTLDQIRADVCGDLLLEGRAPAHPKAARGIHASVVVTVPALSLLDDDIAAQSEPAVVEGAGPIPLSRARELCGTASSWIRVLTHPETGIVLSYGRKRYRPPDDLRRLVRWRADRCLAPGCGMPASRCHIDHNVAWEAGGTTDLANLAPFCEGHHIVKHHGGWTVTQIPDSGGAIEWTSPTGRRYLVAPERRIPVFTPDPGARPPASEGVPPF